MKIINQIFYSLVTGCVIFLFIAANAMAAPVSTWNFSEGSGPIAADSVGSNTAILGHENFNNGFTGSLWVPKAYLVTTPLTDTTQPIDITDAGGRAVVTPYSGIIELYASSIGTAATDVYNFAWTEQTGSPAYLAGDFDVSIGYNRTDNSSNVYNYAVPLRFQVNFANGGYIYAEYFTQYIGGAYRKYVRGVSQLTGAASATAGVNVVAPVSGALRLKRAGTTWTLYYLNGGSWSALHTVSGAPITAGTGIFAYTYNNRKNGALAFSTQLDNFWVYTSPLWASGHVDLGNAVSFDGADDYLSLGDVGTMENIGTFSAEFWMKGPSTQKDWAVLLAKGSDQDSSSSWRIQRAGATDVLRWSVTNASSTSAATLTTSTIFDNQWHHIAATYDGTNIRIYRDGVLEGTPAALTGNIKNSTDTVSMGNYNATSYAAGLNWTARAYSGLLDNVVVYDTVLDATTIAQHADVINIPKAVTDLTASYSGGNFTLNWTAPSSGNKPITSYEIYYSSDAFATAGTLAADSDGNAANATATLTGITLTPQMSFKIKAVNSASTGPDSNIFTLTLTPDAATGLSASYNGSDFLLNWTTPNDNGSAITSYEIYYSSDGFATAGTLATDGDGNATNATATVTGISLTSQISFKIKAVNGAGSGTDSNIATVLLRPDAIINLNGSYNSGSSSFQLTWPVPNNNGSAITGYQVYYSVNSFATAGTLVADSDGNATDATATITGLTLVPSMSFRVNAVNAAGEAPDSNTAIVTFTLPGTITTLSVVPAMADGQATLTWTAPADNGEPITDYIVEYDAGSGWQIFNDGVNTTTGAIVTGLSNASPGLAVDFRVTTTNQYLSSLSNVAYGFPFPAEGVVWAYTDGTFTTGDLSGYAEAESSKTIAQDGGVEATVTSQSTTVCWSGSGCTVYTPSYAGLSPPDYDQQIPKYAFGSRNSSTNAMHIYVNGTEVGSVAGSGVVRVERVGTEIKFVMSNIVRYTADISAETFTDLLADGYAPGGISSAKIYGTGLQAPTDIGGLKASPGYGDAEVSLTWTAPYDNNDPITDYVVEYDAGSGWQTFTHTLAITTPPATVTGLDSTVPGSAVKFRVAAVNNSGTSSYSNEVYGFPFDAEAVVWWYVNGAVSGNSITSGDAESSKLIAQDGGVEATIMTYQYYPNGCWYSSCQQYAPVYIGLSPPDYDQQTPKYAMQSKVNSTAATYVIVNGATVNTIAGNGVVRVERVGNNIQFVMDDIVYHTVDISADMPTDLVADGYKPAGGGAVSNVKIYGAHIQAPAPILDLVARPAVGWQQVGLEWTIPPANNASITDFLVEYNVDDISGTWVTFPHSAIVPAPGDTTASILVTGLNGGVPGRADFFRVSAINAQGTSSPSNVVHGFPFINANVNWTDLDGSATTDGTGLLTGNGTAESFQFIEQDGGVEAVINSGGSYPSGCWYSSCWQPTYSSVGLSPADYDQPSPKYGISSADVGSGAHVRVERVGNKIHFVNNDVVYNTIDISAEAATVFVAHGVASGQNSSVNATIFGAVNPVTVNAFNAVEPATHNHDVPSTDPVDGTIHTKVVGQEISLNIVALRDTNGDTVSDAVETNFSINVNRRVQVQLGTVVDPGLSCTAPNNFTAWQPTMDVFDDTTSSYVPVNWGAAGIEMVFRATDPGQKTIKFKIYGQTNQNIGLMMTDVDLSTCSLSSDTFTLRPNNYTLFVGHNGAPGNDAPGDTALNNFTTAGTTIHKAGRPVRLRISALDVCDLSTPSCTVQPVQNFNHNMELAATDKGHTDMSDTAGVFSSVLLNLYDRDAVNPIQFVPADGGVTTIDDASYDEVGIITISIANDADYAANDATDGSNAADLEITGATLNAGRFVPDHLAFNNAGNMVINVTEGIGNSFTYIGQPFSIGIDNVDIDARNATNGITVNYTGNFWKLGNVTDATADATGATDRNANPITLATTGLVHAPSTATGSDGTVRTNYAPVAFSFNRPAPLVGALPFTPFINLTISGIEDSDDVKLADGTDQVVVPIATAQQLFGRVALSSTTDGTHRVEVVMEFIPPTGGWIENGLDDCGGNCPGGVLNSFDLDNVILNNGTITNQNAGSDPTIAINGGSTTASISAWGDSENWIEFTTPAVTTGVASLIVTPDLIPGGTNDLPWLSYPNMSATVCFACDAGSNNIMYQREPLR